MLSVVFDRNKGDMYVCMYTVLLVRCVREFLRAAGIWCVLTENGENGGFRLVSWCLGSALQVRFVAWGLRGRVEGVKRQLRHPGFVVWRDLRREKERVSQAATPFFSISAFPRCTELILWRSTRQRAK